MRKKTHEEFEAEVKELVGKEYTVVGTYQNNYMKIQMRHNACGQIYEVKPFSFLQGKRCPYCNGSKKKTQEEFESEVKTLVGEEYTLIGFYQNTNTKIKMKHNVCGKIYEVKPNNFLGGSRCPYCSGSQKKTQEEFESEVKTLVGEEYTVIGFYQNTDTKIKMKHNVCGHTYEVLPKSFLRGNRCPYCYGTHKKTQKEFESEVKKLAGEEYTILGTYQRSNKKIQMRHSICGQVYAVVPNAFLRGHRCPICSTLNRVKIAPGKVIAGYKILAFAYESNGRSYYECRSPEDTFCLLDERKIRQYQLEKWKQTEKLKKGE